MDAVLVNVVLFAKQLFGGIADVGFGDEERYLAVGPDGTLDIEETMRRLHTVMDLVEWVCR